MPARPPLVAILLLLTTLPIRLYAQDDSKPMVFATYFECDPGHLGQADAAVKNAMAPVLDDMVGKGSIAAWGWLSHYMGGEWSRVGYLVAPDLDTGLDALDSFDRAVSEAAGQLFSACPRHVDYIWSFITASAPATEVGRNRPAAGESTYWVCDYDREGRADELMTSVFAPIFNRHVGQGQLNSWGWYGHYLGGKYRRLLTLDAADHKTVLHAEDAIGSEIESEHPQEWKEFAGICGSHQDYVWDIGTPR